MDERKLKRRSYSSQLRSQQKEITRDRIMDAVAEIISEGRIIDFSVKEVADRAGVSYGSVYRHFPTREALLEGLYETASQVMAQNHPFTPKSLEEIPAMIPKTLEIFEERGTIVQAFTMALAAHNIQPQNRFLRDRDVQKMVMASAPHLSKEAASQAAAIICHLYSSLTWATLKQRFGLSAESTASALTWALQALIQGIIKQNEQTIGSELTC